MNKITNQFASIEQVTDRYLNRKSTETAAQENSVSFEDILRQKQKVRNFGFPNLHRDV